MIYAASNDDIKQCRQNCSNDFKASVKNCNDIFHDTKSGCNDDKKNALDECKELSGINRANCISNIILDYIDCNSQAVNEHRTCINNSYSKLSLCLESCEIEPKSILPGFDLFETQAQNSFLDLETPPSFFDPGSDPFSGRVKFLGEPLNAPVFGTADTIVERKATAILQEPNFSDTIPIEIVALSLVSTNPITVTYNGNTSPELWYVKVVVSPSKQSNGSMNINHSNPQGGTFDSFLFVQPKFIFTRLGDNAVRILDTGALSLPPKELTATDSPWIFEPCHPDVLRVPNFTSNFCPSSTQLGRANTTHNGTNVSHTVLPAREFYGLKHFGCRAASPIPLLIFNPDFNRNLTPFSQYNRTSWGNQSCGPTCAGVILEYWNRTGFPSIMGNYSLGDLIDRLRNLSGTTDENGTSVFGLVEGITRHLRNRSFAVNFTVTVFENDPNQADGTEIFNGQQNGVGVTAKVDNNFTFSDLTREMANETVIILLEGTQGDHFVAANDYTRNANTDGSHNISIMDPAEGGIIDVRMYGNTIELGNENWTIVSVVSVSPVNALPDTDEDGIPDFKEVSCIDNDGDGYGSHCALGDDCDDSNSALNPAAYESCDGVDNDCDGVVDESFDFSNDNNNCGGCGIPCNVAQGFQCCSSQCVQPVGDVNNCGACGAPCSTNHIAVNACTDGQCTGTCDTGFADCNANKRLDGCETNILFDNNNCGACANACPGGFFCGGGFCVALEHST